MSDDLKTLAADLRELATPAATPAGGCIGCGEAKDGGYETEEVGPFCSQCWQSLQRYFSPATPPAPDREALVKRLAEARISCNRGNSYSWVEIRPSDRDAVLALLRTPPTEGR